MQSKFSKAFPSVLGSENISLRNTCICFIGIIEGVYFERIFLHRHFHIPSNIWRTGAGKSQS